MARATSRTAMRHRRHQRRPPLHLRRPAARTIATVATTILTAVAAAGSFRSPTPRLHQRPGSPAGQVRLGVLLFPDTVFRASAGFHMEKSSHWPIAGNSAFYPLVQTDESTAMLCGGMVEKEERCTT